MLLKDFIASGGDLTEVELTGWVDYLPTLTQILSNSIIEALPQPKITADTIFAAINSHIEGSPTLESLFLDWRNGKPLPMTKVVIKELKQAFESISDEQVKSTAIKVMRVEPLPTQELIEEALKVKRLEEVLANLKNQLKTSISEATTHINTAYNAYIVNEFANWDGEGDPPELILPSF